MLRELQNIIFLRDWRKPTGRAEWSVGILGGIIALIGIILALGGAELIAAGGSWYYLFAGLALIVAGLAIARRKLLGAWIYVGTFLVTALWSFWEVGLNGWALVPRLVGPLVLLLLVILSLPVLDANRGRRRSLLALGGFTLMCDRIGRRSGAGQPARRSRRDARTIRASHGGRLAHASRRRLARLRRDLQRAALLAARPDQSRERAPARTRVDLPHRRYAEGALGRGNDAAQDR